MKKATAFPTVSALALKATNGNRRAAAALLIVAHALRTECPWLAQEEVIEWATEGAHPEDVLDLAHGLREERKPLAACIADIKDLINTDIEAILDMADEIEGGRIDRNKALTIAYEYHGDLKRYLSDQDEFWEERSKEY